jgi:hypothetical protein
MRQWRTCCRCVGGWVGGVPCGAVYVKHINSDHSNSNMVSCGYEAVEDVLQVCGWVGYHVVQCM